MFEGMADLLGRRKSSPIPLIQRNFLFRPGCMEREWRVSHDPPLIAISIGVPVAGLLLHGNRLDWIAWSSHHSWFDVSYWQYWLILTREIVTISSHMNVDFLLVSIHHYTSLFCKWIKIECRDLCLYFYHQMPLFCKDKKEGWDIKWLSTCSLFLSLSFNRVISH